MDPHEGSYCNGNCDEGRNCNCELGSPWADEWLSDYHLLCAVVAVALIAITALSFPNGWFQ